MTLVNTKRYDPRLGQDFKLGNRSRTTIFSSVEHGFYVQEWIGEVDWTRVIDPLASCLKATSQKGFFVVTPWQRRGNRLKSEIKKTFQNVQEFENSLCGYFDIDKDSLSRLFHIRNKFGSGASGEWGLGGCTESLAAPRRFSLSMSELWDLFHVLGQPAKIGCFLYLGELAQSTFLTRIFDDVDEIISKLNSVCS
jgi:hypothetical protein